MKIELKKVSVSLRRSEETLNFVADVYLNGKKVATADNDGRGGETCIRPYTDYKDINILSGMVEYCKTLPHAEYRYDGKTLSYEVTLPVYIDQLVEEYLKAKDLENSFKKGIVYIDPNQKGERILEWKGKKLKDMLSTPLSRIIVKGALDTLKARGCTVLNTNIPKEVYS